MPPKKKAAPKNGYYFLMIEYKRQEEERGRYITMKKASDEVKDIWKYMDPAEKERYNKLADKYKIDQCLEKYNTLGMSFTELKRIEHEREEEKMLMDVVIKDTVHHLDRKTTLRTKEFHVIHLNYYCETETGHFIPAEIAIAKFCLQDGISDLLHTYVSPGELPLGYRYVATEHINHTHKTPIDWDKGETDMNKLFVNIQTFLKPDGPRGDIPPLYTMPDNLNTNASAKAVKGVLQELCINQGIDPDTFRVYMLPKLFFEIRNACKGSQEFPTLAIAESELERDVFNYSKGIACKFHEDEDVMQFCSLSTVQRWVFLICDHCCMDLGIDMIPGNHCPKTADLEGNYKRFWRPHKENIKSLQNDNEDNAPVQPQRGVTIIEGGQLRQPHPSSILTRHPTPGFLDRDRRASAGGVSSEQIVSPVDRTTQPTNCWSSVTERSGQSRPPTFDDSNYPAIGGLSQGAAGDGLSNRYNAWSGRGRGAGRGRGLAANFGGMNLND